MADDLDRMTGDELIREQIRELRRNSRSFHDVKVGFAAIQLQLSSGNDRFKVIEYDLSICLRGVQTLLLEKATKLQIVKSLADVNAAVERLEREHEQADTIPPDEDTRPDNTIPVPEP